MSETVGDFLLRRLREWGVKRIYGYPGDGIMGALGRAGNDPELVQVCHEGRRRSWRAPTPSSPGRSAFVWLPRGRGHTPPRR